MNTPSYIEADNPGKSGKSGKNAPFGMVERKIARRYLGAKKKDGGVAVIAWISFVCIMLAISAMIIIMSIMNGFRDKVLELTLGSEGHIYVAIWENNIPDDVVRNMEETIRAMSEVDTAVETSQNLGGFIANESLSAGRILGISPENLDTLKLVSGSVKQGSLIGFGQGRGAAHQISMGAVLAAEMGLSAGDRVRILTARARNTPSGPIPIAKYYTIGSIYQTGLFRTDKSDVFMALDQAQLLFSQGRSQGEIQVRLHDPDQVDKVKKNIQEAFERPMIIETWKDKFQDEALALRTEQIAMRFIFVIVVIISTFPILAAMLMLVKNKGRDIATLRTIGATRSSIMRIFFIAGALIGVAGTIAGLAFGILFCVRIDVVQGIIEGITGRPLFPPSVYGITGGVPVKIVWGEVMAVAMCGFAISAIATFFPALGASRTDPVEALRYE